MQKNVVLKAIINYAFASFLVLLLSFWEKVQGAGVEPALHKL